MNDACALAGHDFQPCGSDEQQCDAACKYDTYKCAVCNKTRAQIEKENQVSTAPTEVAVMEAELKTTPRVVAEVLSTDPPATGLVGKDSVKHFSLMEVRPFLKSINARLTRQRYAETPLREYLASIQPVSLAEQYLEFYDKFPFHKEVCAGAKHHHWWKGGLEDHLREMIGIGIDIMDLYPGDFQFSKSDLIIAVFLHDFGKVWTYRYITDDDRAKNPKKFKDAQVFTYTDGQFNILDAESRILLELSRNGIAPTDQQWSAVLFAEGGFSAAMYDFGGRSSTGDTIFSKNHLATFVSVLDQWSAQILGRSIQ